MSCISHATNLTQGLCITMHNPQLSEVHNVKGNNVFNLVSKIVIYVCMSIDIDNRIKYSKSFIVLMQLRSVFFLLDARSNLIVNLDWIWLFYIVKIGWIDNDFLIESCVSVIKIAENFLFSELDYVRRTMVQLQRDTSELMLKQKHKLAKKPFFKEFLTLLLIINQ